MRELTLQEIDLVTGAGEADVCTGSYQPPGGDAGSWEDGTTNALVGIYEGLVNTTSHIIGRVANALDSDG